MTGFESIVIGRSAVPSLAATAVVMAAMPFVFLILWRRRHKPQTRLRWLIAGAAGFLVSARVLELGVHCLCIIADNPVSRFINGNTAAYVLYGTVMAGVFEECGRHIMMKHIMKKDRSRENAVLYGIGHGGIEILAVVLPSIVTYLAVAVLFSAGDTGNALSALNITESTAAAALPSVKAAAAYDFVTAGLSVFERLLAMLLHIGLTVTVYFGIRNGKKACLPAAVILHMLADAFAALYQRGAVPLWTVEAWAALWVAVTAVIAAGLYRKSAGPPENGSAA